MKKVVLLLAALSLAGCNSQPAQTAKTAQPTTTDTAPTVVPAAKPIPVIWKSLSLYGADTGMTIAQFKATLGSRQFTRAECSDANATGHITCAIKDGYMESEFAFSNGTLYSVSFFVVGDASVTDAGRKLKQTYGPWTCLTENERHAWWIHPPAVSPGGHNRRYQALPGPEDLLLIVERTI